MRIQRREGAALLATLSLAAVIESDYSRCHNGVL